MALWHCAMLCLGSSTWKKLELHHISVFSFESFSITFFREKIRRKFQKVLNPVLICRVKSQISFPSPYSIIITTGWDSNNNLSLSLPTVLTFTFCKATAINPTFTNQSLTSDDTGFKNTGRKELLSVMTPLIPECDFLIPDKLFRTAFSWQLLPVPFGPLCLRSLFAPQK